MYELTNVTCENVKLQLMPVFVPKDDVRKIWRGRKKTLTRMRMDNYSHNFWTISLTRSTKMFVSGIFSRGLSTSVT